MTVSKFVAPTSREALRLAREAMGAEAMVLSSRVLADGVEIVAIAPGMAQAMVDRAAPLSAVTAADRQPAAADNDAMLSELQSMKGLLEEQLASAAWSDQQRRDPVRGRLLRLMLGVGFSRRLSRALLEHLPPGQSYEQGVEFVRSELIRTVPAQEDEDQLLARGGVYALMGPTGVGKTTTTAKIAARFVMRFGAEKLALITTDSYRIGAYDQLRIYGKILNVPVYAVKDAADLHLVLQDLRNRHMVLIDTVGMSQRDHAVADHIGMLCSSDRPVKRLLLLNAATHGDTLDEVVHSYKQAATDQTLAGCIFTKVDEATHPGALVDIVIRHRLPVHYISTGQKVPEDLMPANRTSLIDAVLQSSRPGALFVASDADAPDHPAAPELSEELVRARAEAEQLSQQYRHLISSMAENAKQLAAAAAVPAKKAARKTTTRSRTKSADKTALQEGGPDAARTARPDAETGSVGA